MKKSLLALAALFVIQGAAHAQADRSGPYLGLRAAMETMKVKTPSATEDFGTGTSFILDGGYEWAVGPRGALLLGGIYDLDYVLQGGSGSQGTVFSRDSEKLQQKVKWGLYAAPGLYLSDRALVYFKLQHTSMKTDPEGVRSGAPNFRSTGYGVGLRYALGGGHLLTAEWMSLPSSKASFSAFKGGADIAPNLSWFSIGWMYRF